MAPVTRRGPTLLAASAAAHAGLELRDLLGDLLGLLRGTGSLMMRRNSCWCWLISVSSSGFCLPSSCTCTLKLANGAIQHLCTCAMELTSLQPQCNNPQHTCPGCDITLVLAPDADGI